MVLALPSSKDTKQGWMLMAKIPRGTSSSKSLKDTFVNYFCQRSKAAVKLIKDSL